MKNIIKTVIYITAFTLGGIFFQLSCSNSNDSAPMNNNFEKFVYVKKNFPNIGEQSIWISNIDGSNQAEIPIILPSDLSLYSMYTSAEHSSVKLSQDGQILLFTVQKNTTNETYIYSCNIDGTNLQELSAFEGNVGVFL
jgi:hypothetical protein